jgi:hypothetical protein
MTKKDLTALSELKAAEVSLVKRGANKKKRFPIFKEDQMVEEEILKAVLETEAEGEESLIELLTVEKASDKGVSAAKSALRILQAFKDEMPEGVLNALAKVAGMEKAQDKPKEEEEMKKEEEVKKEELPEEAQAIFKAQEEQIKALKEQNDLVIKQLREEKDQRELEAWISKAETELTHFPGKSFEEMGKLLKSLHDVNPETAKEQFETMKAASDALKTSDVFKEAGKRAGVTVKKSAWEKIEELAKGLVEKSNDVNFDLEVAIAKVMDSPRGAELYNEYLDEHPQQCGRRA